LRLNVEPSSGSSQFLSPVRSPLPARHRRSHSLPDSPVCESPGSYYTSILEEYTKESEVDPYMFEELNGPDSNSLKRQGAILSKEKDSDENLLLNSSKEGEILIKFKRESNNHGFAVPVSQSGSETLTLEEEKKTEVSRENISLRVVEELKTRPVTSSSWDLISSPRTPVIGGRGERFGGELMVVLKEFTQQVINMKEESLLVRGRSEHLLVENQKLRDENKLLKQKVRDLSDYKLLSEENKLQRLVERRSVDEKKVKSLCKAYEIYENWSKSGRGDLNGAEEKIENAKKNLRNTTQDSLKEPVNLEDTQDIYGICQGIAKLRAEIKKQQERYVAKIEIPARSSSKN
jgi:hypothetical protein